MCNTCNSCGCNNGCGNNGNNGCGCGNNGYDPLLAALTNLFTPLGGCGCNSGCGCGNLYLVQNVGTVQTRGNNGFGGGCGCNNGCGNNGNNGCGCGNTYDAYYVRQYALGCGCGCNH